MLKKRGAILAVLVAPIFALHAADYIPPSAESAADLIKLRLATDLPRLKQPSVMITMFGSLDSVKLIGSDNQNLTVNYKEKNFDQSWSKMSVQDIVSVADVCFTADTQG